MRRRRRQNAGARGHHGKQGTDFAYDGDLRRLAPIHERIQTKQRPHIQVRSPKGKTDVLADLEGHMDLVLVDAPCTGTGVWRRHPDAKWRMRPGALEIRMREQSKLLDEAVRFAKPGGKIAYVTCSLLDAENGAQIRGFLDRAPGWSVYLRLKSAQRWARRGMGSAEGREDHRRRVAADAEITNTDGFFCLGAAAEIARLMLRKSFRRIRCNPQSDFEI